MLFWAFGSDPFSGKAFRTRLDRRLPGGLAVFYLADFCGGHAARGMQ